MNRLLLLTLLAFTGASHALTIRNSTDQKLRVHVTDRYSNVVFFEEVAEYAEINVPKYDTCVVGIRAESLWYHAPIIQTAGNKSEIDISYYHNPWNSYVSMVVPVDSELVCDAHGSESSINIVIS